MLRNLLIETKKISVREAEVVELVTKGLTNKEVANQLFVTEKTVKFHLTNIYKKMSVKSRSQLIVWCMPFINNTPEPMTAAEIATCLNTNNTLEENENNTPAVELPPGLAAAI